MNGIHVPGSNKCNVEDTKGMMLSVHVMKVIRLKDPGDFLSPTPVPRIVPRCLHVALFAWTAGKR